jgi:phage tail-like protein
MEENTNSMHFYPLTQMNFLVTLGNGKGSAAFSEVTGIDSEVDVVDFRQGNAASLAPVKIPGLVKHQNITLKYGVTEDSSFREWIAACISEQRSAMERTTLTVELIDIRGGSPSSVPINSGDSGNAQKGNLIWSFSNAWVTKYQGPDLNAKESEIAMETVEIAYEELKMPIGFGTGA